MTGALFRRDGRTGYDRRVHLATTSLAQRILLRLRLFSHAYPSAIQDGSFDRKESRAALRGDLQLAQSSLRLVRVRRRSCFCTKRRLRIRSRLGNYYIFMMVLTSSLEAPEFALKGIDVANTIVQVSFSFFVARVGGS